MDREAYEKAEEVKRFQYQTKAFQWLKYLEAIDSEFDEQEMEDYGEYVDDIYTIRNKLSELIGDVRTSLDITLIVNTQIALIRTENNKIKELEERISELERIKN